jgi:hypothetical protein
MKAHSPGSLISAETLDHIRLRLRNDLKTGYKDQKNQNDYYDKNFQHTTPLSAPPDGAVLI